MHHEIEAKSQELEELKKFYLRRWGWTETSSTPGAYWLWKRDFSDLDAKRLSWDKEHNAGKPGRPSPSAPYGIITAPLDLAVAITVRSLDEQPELEDA
jgi:hypothetical protein